jgi:hypothetical protein
MRTTIDVPVSIRQKLIQEAAGRNLQGFSVIIVEALEEYFKNKSYNRKNMVARLKGCLSCEEHAQAMKEVQEGRAQWRT